MATLPEDIATPPEWMLNLENKQKKHRLAHDIGAGAQCLKCADSCPGLDLHFWRKICRNCKCKKEEHDIIDEYYYQQFEILLGPSDRTKARPTKAVLKLDHQYTAANVVNKSKGIELCNTNGITFDWVPPNISSDMAAEYMCHLPVEKIPICGSDGAVYRRQQLEKQIPLHDLTVSICHDLSQSEIKAFQQYLDNLRNNAVGQGRVGKLDITRENTEESSTFPGKDVPQFSQPLCDSHSLQSLNLNALPKPFVPYNFALAQNVMLHHSPQPFLTHPIMNLKTPSSFLTTTEPLKKESITQTIDPKLTKLSGQFDVVNPQPTESTNPSYSGELSKLHNESFILSGETFVDKLKRQEMVHSPQVPQFECFHTAKLNAVNNNNVSGLEMFREIPENQCNNAGKIKYETLDNKLNYTAQNYPEKVESIAFSLPHKRELYSIKNPTNYIEHSTCLPQHSDKSLYTGMTFPIKNTVIPLHSLPVSNSIPVALPSFTQQCNNNSELHNKSDNNIIAPYQNDRDLSKDTQQKINSSINLEYPNQGNNPLLGEVTGLLTDIEIAELPIRTQDVKSLNCNHCLQAILPQQVTVLADRAAKGSVWHPQCFVCHICKELLVDLVYFFNKGNVYCGRHYAEMLNIPRCLACDELIFVREYTVAEGHTFHVRHFCCFECDCPLAGKQYISRNNYPYCLDCFHHLYSKKCHTCKSLIEATSRGVCWKQLNWHATKSCFCCFQCGKSLLDCKFMMKKDQPFCNKECVFACTDI